MLFRSLADEFCAVGHGGVVRFIGTEEPPNRMQLAEGLGSIHSDVDGKGVGVVGAGGGVERESERGEKEGSQNSILRKKL